MRGTPAWLGLAAAAACLVVAPIPTAHALGGQPQVETSALGELGMELAPRVAEATTPLLEEAGFDAATVRISMGWLNADEFHYGIKVALDPETPLDQAPLTATCRDCSSAELVDAAVKGVNKAINNEERRRREAEPMAPLGEQPTEVPARDPTLEDPAPPPETTLAEAERSPGRAGPLRPLGWAGIGLMGAGVVVATTGGVFAGLGERRLPDDMSQVRDFRPSGYALLGTGGVLLLAGAIMLGVERAKSKNRKVGSRGGPSGAPANAGTGLRFRF